MDELESIKVTFFQECDELLGDLEQGLLAMESGADDGETVNAVFRAVHSIKGGAGAFGFETLVRFAHVFETLLDQIRSGKQDLTQPLVATLLRAADILSDLVKEARGDGVADEEHATAMAAELAQLAGQDSAAHEAEDDLIPDFVPMTFSLDPEPEAAPAAQAWTITFKPARALYEHANEPLVLLRELGRVGQVESIELDQSGLPHLDEMEPEESYIGWTIRLATEAGEAAIREVFDFVEDDCELVIAQDGGAVAEEGDLDIAALLASAQSEPAPAAADDGEFDISALLASVKDEAPATSGEVDISALLAAVQEPLPEAAPTKASESAPPAAKPAAVPAAAKPAETVQPQATIRVDPERIDKLIDLVGELVINQAMLAQRVAECGLAPTSQVCMGLDDLEQLTREIQDSVMAIRAQAVKSVFQRMPRLVREVAAMTGKQARLVTDGENTEVDKTVIERLSDPITHMIRNAIDHGLESPEERLAAGKPAEGTIRLAALHRGGRIVIEVSDDGKGINRKRVHQIAMDKGLIDPEVQLSDEEIDNLIFLPGFSTAETISDVSGRGVGMDVVRRSIQGLGGRIVIASRPGEGSTFTMSLPLTLAVLDGMVIEVAGQTLVVPLNAIVESSLPKTDDVKALGPSGYVFSVRGAHVPLIDIGQTLGYRAECPPPTDSVILLIESEAGGRAALLADSIQGQRQVVIKSLEANYRQVEGIGAATILGDGRVALILDVDAVVAMRRPVRIPETLIAAE